MSNFGNSPVLGFSYVMQQELDNNKQKGTNSWRKDCSLDYLLKRLYEEVDEIGKCIETNSSIKSVISECGDVANFAMMIADIYKRKNGNNKKR